MRLIKRICKRCMITNGYKWQGNDDKMWREGTVDCPPELGGDDLVVIIDKIPANCAYPPSMPCCRRRRNVEQGYLQTVHRG